MTDRRERILAAIDRWNRRVAWMISLAYASLGVVAVFVWAARG